MKNKLFFLLLLIYIAQCRQSFAAFPIKNADVTGAATASKAPGAISITTAYTSSSASLRVLDANENMMYKSSCLNFATRKNDPDLNLAKIGLFIAKISLFSVPFGFVGAVATNCFSCSASDTHHSSAQNFFLTVFAASVVGMVAGFGLFLVDLVYHVWREGHLW